MKTVIRCPNPECDASFGVAPEHAGRGARCPRCGTRFRVPVETVVGREHEPDPPPTPPTAPGPGEGGVPARIGRYRVKRRLGRGGMGAVYLAGDEELDREVAVKVPDREQLDPEFLERFRREARAAAGFRHPNFCPVYEVGLDGGVPFLVMAYIEGRTLADRIRSGPVPPREAATIVRDLAAALEEAHGRGIVHRDLKPGNVMIDGDGTLIIMDFGLARRTDREEPELTRAGQALGTPAYMSPEQVRGDRGAIGPGSDLYALGVILYEMLAGRRPFVGNASQLFVQIATVAPPPPSGLRDGIDPALEAICLRSLAKEPKDRPPSCRALAAELDRWIAATGEAPTVTVGPAEGGADPPAPPSRRSWLIAGAAAVAVAAVGGALAVGRGRTGADDPVRPGPAPEPAAVDGGRSSAPAPAPATRWALEFDGHGYARTNLKYDWEGPVLIEARAASLGRNVPFPAELVAGWVVFGPRNHGMKLIGLSITPDGYWSMGVRNIDAGAVANSTLADPSGAFVTLRGTYLPRFRRVSLTVDALPVKAAGDAEGPPGLAASLLLGACYTPGGRPAPDFHGRIAWVRVSDAMQPPAADPPTDRPPPADDHTKLLLDFTRGPDDPAIRRAIADGLLTLEGARFVEIDDSEAE